MSTPKGPGLQEGTQGHQGGRGKPKPNPEEKPQQLLLRELQWQFCPACVVCLPFAQVCGHLCREPHVAAAAAIQVHITN